jgi:hypothetical protein
MDTFQTIMVMLAFGTFVLTAAEFHFQPCRKKKVTAPPCAKGSSYSSFNNPESTVPHPKKRLCGRHLPEGSQSARSGLPLFIAKFLYHNHIMLRV